MLWTRYGPTNGQARKDHRGVRGLTVERALINGEAVCFAPTAIAI
jgi:hypothetical protein